MGFRSYGNSTLDRTGMIDGAGISPTLPRGFAHSVEVNYYTMVSYLTTVGHDILISEYISMSMITEGDVRLRGIQIVWE